MNRFDVNNRIPDPVHDYIRISEIESEIMDDPAVQRLRRVSQMGISSLIYPTANHTRFSHSLGVMHVAGKLADSLDFSDTEYLEARFAGLLHDIGHGPFSHTSDRVAQKFGYTHEDISCEIIDSQLTHKLPDEIHVDKIKEYIQEGADINIISGDIDADRIDYLNRDALNIGLKRGIIDYKNIIEFIDIVDGQVVFDQKAIFALSELLTARFYMHQTVVNHHTTLLAERMLEKTLYHYAKQNGVMEMMRMDDYEMHTELLSLDSKNVQEQYSRLINRDLLKRCFAVHCGTSSNQSEMEYQTTYENIKKLADINAYDDEAEIADELGINKNKIIIVKPRTNKKEELDINIYNNGSIEKLSAHSHMPQAILREQKRNAQFYVYTTDALSETVGEYCKDKYTTILNDN